MHTPPASRHAGTVSLSRRQFARRLPALVAFAHLSARVRGAGASRPEPGRMKISLHPGSIGVSATQRQAIELAARHGFDAVEPFGGSLTALPESEFASLLDLVRTNGLSWGAANLSTDFRRDDAAFAASLQSLPREAAALAKAGVQRVGTWISPGHGSLTYLQNFRLHTRRLREIARVLQDHKLRLGLEYVGTPTLRQNRRHGFIHTLAETRELIAEIGTDNVGVILDSWHWWTSGDLIEEIQALTPPDIVSVDLNDAPAGIPREQQIDNRRELPGATGVIDLAAFLGALRRIGYDGPVRAEPFNRILIDLDNDAACAATIQAMREVLKVPRDKPTPP